ncbi:hypothetical protein [Thermococcus sp.]
MRLLENLKFSLSSSLVKKKENAIPVPVMAQKEEHTKKECGWWK